jgi:amidohydrolase
MIGWRRHLHRNPEVSFRETETARFIRETLAGFDGLEISRPTENSVVARLIGERPGPTVALRADIDALPITEQNDFEFASANPGAMHACGHDGHTAMLLGAAKVLSTMRAELGGEVRFIFQHAEELSPGGAEQLVEKGVMEGVDAVMGIHLWSQLPVGKVGLTYGPMMAAPDIFHITVRGHGGHAAMPHQAVDSIAVGAQIVTNLQHVVSREIDPTNSVVLSVTRFQGGTTHNVIPGTVEMQGTVRTFDPNVRERVPELMERVIRGVTAAHDADYEFSYERGYRPVINDDDLTSEVAASAGEVVGGENVELMPPTMGGEDFSAYGQKAPSAFYLVGAGNEQRAITASHHHPLFTIDEDALQIGLKMHLSTVLRLLGDGRK